MTQEKFTDLIKLVQEKGANPPEHLFDGGVDDWHARARLAHFLVMEGIDSLEDAEELFLSVKDAEPNTEDSQDVEEKIYALQGLAGLYRRLKKYPTALDTINQAIELAESTDYLYKYIVRGELWGDRWNIMQLLDQGTVASKEIDERIAAFKDAPISHNSYLYYGYRFKAQLAAVNLDKEGAKDLMRKALSYMDITPADQAKLDEAFKPDHDNLAWILAEIDRATPNPSNVHWDI